MPAGSVRGLNIVSADADRELDAIRSRIAAYEIVTGLDHVQQVLQAYATRGERIGRIDAIGHSRSHGFLVLGAWTVDDSPQTAASFRVLLQPALGQLGVRVIRLLGCSTARTERGRNTIRRIARATGCEVLGTKRYISHDDYAPAGFISDEALVA